MLDTHTLQVVARWLRRSSSEAKQIAVRFGQRDERVMAHDWHQIADDFSLVASGFLNHLAHQRARAEREKSILRLCGNCRWLRYNPTRCETDPIACGPESKLWQAKEER